MTMLLSVMYGFIGWMAVATLAIAANPPQLTFEAASAESYNKPHDIVLSPDGERLYVADNDNDRIAVLDAHSLRELGFFGDGELSGPHDVVFDAKGLLLVADTGNSRIAVYRVEGSGGSLVGELRGRIRSPEGVAVHPDGRVLATGAATGNLVAYREGQVIDEVGGFAAPHDVEIDAEGAIWVADSANDRVVRLDDNLKTTAVLSGSPYDFRGPRYLGIDAAGRLYVADKYSHSIKIIAPDGTLVKVLGGDSSGKGDGVFDRPEGVEIHGADVWFSDTYNNRIVRYRVD